MSAATRPVCTCWDYEDPNAECTCGAGDKFTAENMATDIGPACKGCGETLWHYVVVTGRFYTDVAAKCATCAREKTFGSRMTLDHVADVRRRHFDLADLDLNVT